jgi:hypothetical protein
MEGLITLCSLQLFGYSNNLQGIYHPAKGLDDADSCPFVGLSQYFKAYFFCSLPRAESDITQGNLQLHDYSVSLQIIFVYCLGIG